MRVVWHVIAWPLACVGAALAVIGVAMVWIASEIAPGIAPE